jgi:hypothetical protein
VIVYNVDSHIYTSRKLEEKVILVLVEKVILVLVEQVNLVLSKERIIITNPSRESKPNPSKENNYNPIKEINKVEKRNKKNKIFSQQRCLAGRILFS